MKVFGRGRAGRRVGDARAPGVRSVNRARGEAKE